MAGNLKIYSDSDWSIISKPDWIDVVPSSGNGNTDLTVVPQPNYTESLRMGNVVATTIDGTVTISCVVNQDKSEIAGNSVYGLKVGDVLPAGTLISLDTSKTVVPFVGASASVGLVEVGGIREFTLEQHNTGRIQAVEYSSTNVVSGFTMFYNEAGQGAWVATMYTVPFEAVVTRQDLPTINQYLPVTAWSYRDSEILINPPQLRPLASLNVGDPVFPVFGQGGILLTHEDASITGSSYYGMTFNAPNAGTLQGRLRLYVEPVTQNVRVADPDGGALDYNLYVNGQWDTPAWNKFATQDLEQATVISKDGDFPTYGTTPWTLWNTGVSEVKVSLVV